MRKEIPESDLEMLLKKTNFSETDIKEWFDVFMKECPDGFLRKEMVYHIFQGNVLDSLISIKSIRILSLISA